MKEKIAKKPWPVHIKKRTIEALERAKTKKTPKLLFLDELVYFVLLFLGIIGNFIISVVLVPFMLVLSGIYLYITLFIIGLAFGALINVMLIEIHKIEQRVHIMPGVLMAALALINVYIMARLANLLMIKLHLYTPQHSPIILSTSYVLAFLIPHFITTVKGKV